MVNTSVQVIGFIVGIIGWILAIMTTFIQAWRKNDLQGEIIELVRETDGLWSKCIIKATGLWTCDDYDSVLLGLPVALQGARALAIISLLLGLIGTVLSGLGLKCTKFGSGSGRMKAYMVMIAGLLHALGGATIGAAVSWFASNILTEFYNITVPNEGKFVYGEALFVGWGAMVVSVVSGVILCCGSWDSEDNVGRGYVYNPPKPKLAGTDYV